MNALKQVLYALIIVYGEENGTKLFEELSKMLIS